MIDKEQYCIGFDGIIKTKGSEVLHLMGYSIGDVIRGSIQSSERFKNLMTTHNFKEVPEEMWKQYLLEFMEFKKGFE